LVSSNPPSYVPSVPWRGKPVAAGGSVAGGSGVTAAGAWPVGKGANVKLVATSADTVMLPYTTEPELPRSFLGRMVAHLSNT